MRWLGWSLAMALSCNAPSEAPPPEASAAPAGEVEPIPSASSSAPPPAPKPAPEPPQPPCPDDNSDRAVSLMHYVHSGDAKRVAQIVHRYRCRHPKRAKVVELGRTHLNLPILALYIGRDMKLATDKPTILLNGGHHGAELMSTQFVLDAIGTLLEDDSPETRRVLDEVVVVAVPLVNPDGNHLTTTKKIVGRKNGRDNNGDGYRSLAEGVDLNRNYPFRWGALGTKGSSPHGVSQYYRGPSAGSEPETQAMMRLAERERFAASISYHTGTVAILAPYTIPGVKTPEPHVNEIVALEITAGITTHPEGRLPVRKNLYPVDGTDQDWLFHTFGTLALLVEGVDNGARPQSHRRMMVEAIRKSWQLLIARFLDGPAISGRVVDDSGHPVEAKVSIDEIVTYEGEAWTSRPRDGRFDRFVATPGEYTVRVGREGHDDVTRKVRVERREHVEIALP